MSDLKSEWPVAGERQRFTVRDVFVGGDGLRAGWRLAIFAAILFALFNLVGGFLPNEIARPASGERPLNVLILLRPHLVSEGVLFLCVMAATGVMALFGDAGREVYGLAPRRVMPNLLAGMAWGAAVLSLLVLVLHGAGLLVFDGRMLGGSSAVRYGVAWGFGFLLVGLFEETLFRGYAQATLARGLTGMFEGLRTPNAEVVGFWTAAVLLSFGFGLLHTSNQGETPVGLVSAGLIGLVFCFSLWRTGTLWWAIGFHAAWDWAQSFLYGVADSGTIIEQRLRAAHPVGNAYWSGGVTGPEGSLLILPVTGVVAGVIWMTLRGGRLGREGQTTAKEEEDSLRE